MSELLPESPEGSELPVSEAGAGVATLVVVALSAGADSGTALVVSAVAGLVVPPLPCAGAEPLSCVDAGAVAGIVAVGADAS